MTLGLINANPIVREKKERISRSDVHLHCDHHDAVDPLEIYDFVRDIRDPEHPYSLEQLSVLSEESITVDEKLGRILITFTPTIQHCSMATVIGLCLRVKLKDCFPPHFKVDIKVAPGSHADEQAGQAIERNHKKTINHHLNRMEEERQGTRRTSSRRNPKFKFSNKPDTAIDVDATSNESEEPQTEERRLRKAVNKQLNDKERLVAAMENPNLRQLVDECLHSSDL